VQSFLPLLKFIETAMELQDSSLIKGVRHEAIYKLGNFGHFSGRNIGGRGRVRWGRQQSQIVEKKNLQGKP